MDPLQESKRDTAIMQARRLYPNISPVMAGWVYDYVESVGEEEMEKRIREGCFENKSTDQ